MAERRVLRSEFRRTSLGSTSNRGEGVTTRGVNVEAENVIEDSGVELMNSTMREEKEESQKGKEENVSNVMLVQLIQQLSKDINTKFDEQNKKFSNDMNSKFDEQNKKFSNDMNSKFDEQNKEISHKFDEQKETFSKQVKNIELQHKAFRDDINELKNEFKNLHKDLNEKFKVQSADVEKKLENSLSKITKNMEEQLKNKARNLENDINKVHSQVATLNTDLNEQKENISKINNNLVHQNKTLVTLETKFNCQVNEVDRSVEDQIKNKVTTVKDELTQEVERKVRKEVESIREELYRKDSEIAELRRNIEQQEVISVLSAKHAFNVGQNYKSCIIKGISELEKQKHTNWNGFDVSCDLFKNGTYFTNKAWIRGYHSPIS